MTVDLFAIGNKKDGEILVLREFVFNSESYATKYDEIQKTIHEISGIDDLLAGMPYTHEHIHTTCTYVQVRSMYNMNA